MKLLRIIMAAALALAGACTLTAQPAQTFIKVHVNAGNADWLYKKGDKITYEVTVTKNSVPLENVEIRYEISEDMLPAHKTGTEKLKKGTGTIDGGKMNKPGFLRCRVWVEYEGKRYEGIATAGVDPDKIQPTVKDPADFDAFWGAALDELKKVPVEPNLRLIPERCTADVEVYHVGLRVLSNGAKVYGILTKPRAEGKYPVLLLVPGAGIRQFNGDINSASQGFITLQIGIHGIPVDLPQGVYEDLARGALLNYNRIKLEDKDNYYYKRVYLGCVRAIDYLTSLPEWDGRNVIVRGGSQGGALSIVTAGLDSRVTGIAANYPALADIPGYAEGRGGGWPHMFRDGGDSYAKTEKLETVKYYDVVNFARRVKAPGIYFYGYNDMVCCPTSVCSAYNVISAPKQIVTCAEIAHWTYPEHNNMAWNWILRSVGR